MLRRGRVQQRGVEARLGVDREELVEDLLRRRLELVRGAGALGGPFRGCDRQQVETGGDLVHSRLVAGEEDLDGIDVPGGEGVERRGGDGSRVAVSGSVGHTQIGVLDPVSPIAEIGLGLLPHRVQRDVLALAVQLTDPGLGETDDVGGIGAGEPTVGGHDDQTGHLHLAPLQEPVLGAGDATHVLDDLDQLGGIRLGAVDPGLGLGDATGGDQLHGAGDLLDRLDAPDPASCVPKLGRGHEAAYSSVPEPSKVSLNSAIAASTVAASGILPLSLISVRTPG